MLGFFAIRRLSEAHKITDRVMARPVRVQRYSLRGFPPGLMNWHRVDEHYDLRRGRRDKVSLDRFCNQAIHSFVFMPLERSTTYEGVLLASDWERKRSLLRVTLAEIERIFVRVADDQVNSSRYTRMKDKPWEYTVSLE